MKKIIVGVSVIGICAFLYMIAGVFQKDKPEEIKSLVGYHANVVVDDIMMYIGGEGQTFTNKVPNISGEGYTLTVENSERFEELFEGQMMGETFKDEVYTYDVIFDMTVMLLAVNVSEGKAYYLYNKDEPIETYEFNLTSEQKKFLVELLEKYE